MPINVHPAARLNRNRTVAANVLETVLFEPEILTWLPGRRDFRCVRGD
jgi:hypothetical protein